MAERATMNAATASLSVPQVDSDEFYNATSNSNDDNNFMNARSEVSNNVNIRANWPHNTATENYGLTTNNRPGPATKRPNTPSTNHPFIAQVDHRTASIPIPNTIHVRNHPTHANAAASAKQFVHSGRAANLKAILNTRRGNTEFVDRLARHVRSGTRLNTAPKFHEVLNELLAAGLNPNHSIDGTPLLCAYASCGDATEIKMLID